MSRTQNASPSENRRRDPQARARREARAWPHPGALGFGR